VPAVIADDIRDFEQRRRRLQPRLVISELCPPGKVYCLNVDAAKVLAMHQGTWDRMDDEMKEILRRGVSAIEGLADD